MIDTAELTINTTKGSTRLVVRVPPEMPPANADGTVTVSMEVLDVLEPPSAREAFLEDLRRRKQIYEPNM